MAGFDDALERLVTDPGFRAQVEQDPQAALADYDLTDDERQLLTSQLSHEAGASGGVEQRTSKSGLAGALGMFDVGADTPQESDLAFASRLMEDETAVDTDPSVTTGVPTQADGHTGEMDIESWSWGETQSGWVYDENSSCWIRVSPVGASSDQSDPAMAAGGGEHEPAATDDPIPQEHMSLNFGKVEHTGDASETMSAGGSGSGLGTGSGSGKANVQDLTMTMPKDAAGDPDQPVVVGSVYNAEDAGEDGDYGYMDDDIPSGAPPPSDGANEVQDGLSNTVAVSETTDEPDSAGPKKGNVEYEWKVEEGVPLDGGDPTDLAGSEPPAEGNKLFVGGLSFGTDDAAPGGGQNEIQFEDAPGTEEADSHGMGSPYLKKACFDNTMDPSGNPDDLVADGNEEIASSPAIMQSLTNNEVMEHDDVMTDQDPDADTKEAPVKTGYDLKPNKRV